MLTSEASGYLPPLIDLPEHRVRRNRPRRPHQRILHHRIPAQPSREPPAHERDRVTGTSQPVKWSGTHTRVPDRRPTDCDATRRRRSTHDRVFEAASSARLLTSQSRLMHPCVQIYRLSRAGHRTDPFRHPIRVWSRTGVLLIGSPQIPPRVRSNDLCEISPAVGNGLTVLFPQHDVALF